MRQPKRIKPEPAEDAKPSLISIVPHTATAEAVSTPVIKTEAQEQQNITPEVSFPMDVSQAAKVSTKPKARGKEKAKIMLQLEELKLKQRLMELEDEDEE